MNSPWICGVPRARRKGRKVRKTSIQWTRSYRAGTGLNTLESGWVPQWDVQYSCLKLSHVRKGDVHDSAGCERLEALFAPREGDALRIGHSDQQAPSVSTEAVQASGGASYEVSFCNGSSWWSSTRKEGPTPVAFCPDPPFFISKARRNPLT